MYFDTKIYLKSTRNHTVKHPIQLQTVIAITSSPHVKPNVNALPLSLSRALSLSPSLPLLYI
jgi:hypothetical protein